MITTMARRRWRSIGVDCELVVAAPSQGGADVDQIADEAAVTAVRQLAELDQACFRFRDDSELSRLQHGTAVRTSPVFSGALASALHAARVTDGLVDPTVGGALRANGYDDDLSALAHRQASALRRRLATVPEPAPGHWRIHHDPARGEVLVPRGVELDFGATAKAWAVDRCAAVLAHRHDVGILINFGGDLAVVGPAPEGGWQVDLDDANDTPADQRPVITVRHGAMASSSTAKRRWRTTDGDHHHVIDPRTGRSATAVWRTVTVAARSCELANTASTAAIVLGTDAPVWLARRGLHARLVSTGGAVVYVGDWPVDHVPR